MFPMPPEWNLYITVALLGLVTSLSMAISYTRNLLSAVIFLSLFSLLMALTYVLLDAPDVALTEAAIGACIGTVIFIATIAITGYQERMSHRFSPSAFLLVTVIGILLLYGIVDMPNFGDPSAPIQQHVAPHYIQQSGEETGVPNIVASILASYRGFDTLGEANVILAGALCSLVLLRRCSRRGTHEK